MRAGVLGPVSRGAFHAAVLALSLAGAAGCAQPAPPGGGPPDLTPPKIVAASPDSGATNVPRDVTIRVEFDKHMDHRSVEDYVFTAPPIRIGEVRWSGRGMEIVPRDSLQANTTYLATIGTGARDLHGNALMSAKNLVFSTGSRIRQGRISGHIETVKQDPSGLFIWLYQEGLHADSMLGRDDPDLVGQTGSDGRFQVLGLGLDRVYSIHIFADLNRNRSFDPGSEYMLHVDRRVKLTDSVPSDTGFILKYVDPKLPGSVAGRMDTTLMARRGAVRLECLSDTTLSQTAIPDARGGFLLRLAPAGRYRIYWFTDTNGNQLPDPGETRGEPFQLDLGPGEDVIDLSVPLNGTPRLPAKLSRDSQSSPGPPPGKDSP